MPIPKGYGTSHTGRARKVGLSPKRPGPKRPTRPLLPLPPAEDIADALAHIDTVVKPANPWSGKA